MPNLKMAQEFYCDGLGFKVRSTQYLPALPLGHSDGKFAFMLHERDVELTSLNPDQTQTLIIFMTDNIYQKIITLKRKGISISSFYNNAGDVSETYLLTDPFGNISLLTENR